jgi:hypothetical protein
MKLCCMNEPYELCSAPRHTLNRHYQLESFALSEMVKWGEFKYRRDNGIMRITV